MKTVRRVLRGHNSPTPKMGIIIYGIEFFYDTASFLSEYAGIFSLSGLEKITGVSQAQLGHFLHGRRKPSRKTIDKIQSGVDRFAKELTAIKFS